MQNQEPRDSAFKYTPSALVVGRGPAFFYTTTYVYKKAGRHGTGRFYTYLHTHLQGTRTGGEMRCVPMDSSMSPR